jgi:DNA-binding MarR family transcriptional regulator
MSQTRKIKMIRDGLRRFNRRAGVLKTDPYAVGLSLSQSSALVDLGRLGPLTPGQLTKLLQLEKSSVSRLLDVLAAKAFIKFQRASGDGRSKNIVLTALGEKTAERINAISNNSVQEILQGLCASEQEQLAKAFAAVARVISEFEDQG